MIVLKGISILCNYPYGEFEVDVSINMELTELASHLKRLIEAETEMTSFVLTASIAKGAP